MHKENIRAYCIYRNCGTAKEANTAFRDGIGRKNQVPAIHRYLISRLPDMPIGSYSVVTVALTGASL